MADIIIPLDEYKKLLRLANKADSINDKANPTITQLQGELYHAKKEISLWDKQNKLLLIELDGYKAIPKWIVNLFKPKYDVELMHKFLKDE